MANVLPYGRQSIGDDDVEAVVAALRSDWLTTGPRVPEFEEAFAAAAGVPHAVAVSSGTAALHAALDAAGVGPGDEVIVAAMTFVASANAALYLGATPVFADVDPETLLVDPEALETRITPRTKAIVAVDYAGQPCDHPALAAIARRHGLALVADAAHSAGGALEGRAVGSLADLTCFSFHPVKQMTTGEGGMVTTADPGRAAHLRAFRNHGITTDHRERAAKRTVQYEMVLLGFNYRLTDFQAALGLSQLRKLPGFIARRSELAALYARLLKPLSPRVRPLALLPGRAHAWHLYVVKIEGGPSRDEVLAGLRAASIGANVHYSPPYLHPYYRERLGTKEGLCPAAERASGQIVTLPLFPAMRDTDVHDVVEALGNLVR